jgi:alkanesulfonate monooxygenase SsuD/methylene tetrahydromethanopterin reductase-like flavin-dependent oxidoreductase (luciferase family)
VIWRRAEELGFAHAWTYDHLAWRTLRDAPWFAALPTLTAAASVTERLRLGPLVASPNFRHPVSFAKELVTLDDVSAGRITLGIGAGGGGWDATMLGQEAWSVEERAARLAEFVELTDVLLREPAASFAGHYYRADEARTYPGCVQRPRIPFAIAASGPRGMGLAVTHAETWVTTGPRHGGAPLAAPEGARAVREQIDRLDVVCEQQARDPASLGRLVLTGPSLDAGLGSPAAFDDVVASYSDAGVTDLVVHWPRASDPYAADPAVFERIFSR